MPWSGGTYTLPAGTSVTAGNDIESSWANTLTLDVQAAISFTLPRDGSAVMTAALPNFDGTLGLPGLMFNTEPTSGWWLQATEDVRFGLLGQAQYRWTKGAAPNHIPVFEVWDQANTQWLDMPHAFSPTTVEGAWTFNGAATFTSTAALNGVTTIGGAATFTSTADFNGGATFDSDVTFGTVGARGANTDIIYDELLVDGLTGTELVTQIAPASAIFEKGLDSKLPIRIWNNPGNDYMSLRWGHAATSASGSYAIGDFKQEYALEVTGTNGGLQLSRWDFGAEAQYFPAISYFNADATMADSYMQFYYRTRVHNITGWEGRGLLAEDMDDNWKQVGWLLDSETEYSSVDTVPQNDEHRNIILSGAVDYTLTIDNLEAGTWMRYLNLGTAIVTLDGGVNSFAHLDGSGAAFVGTIDLAAGGWAMIHKRDSVAFLVIYGQGLS